MAHVEFFFDLSSPWTYLAVHNIQPILRETDATIVWVPILVGGVFNAVNPSVYAFREDAQGPKMAHMIKSISDWAEWSGVNLHFPLTHHPARSVHAMRMCCALEDDQDALLRFAMACFDAYFGQDRNLDDPLVLQSVADAAGLNGADLLASSQSDTIKAQLRANTQRLIDRGGYGSPTIFVDGADMYFGNDQLPLIARALKRAAPKPSVTTENR